MKKPVLLLCFCLLTLSLSFSQPALEFQSYLGGFSTPVGITNAGDGSNRLFIVERGGQIKIIKNGAVLPVPFIDLSASVLSGGEQGLLGLCFHPNYTSNGYFYVNYTDLSGDTRIVRFGTNPGNPDLADPTNRLVILTVPQPFTNHNAGDLKFGPDGFLYIPLGDGGSGGDPGNRSQNTLELLGKMLRIDIDGGSPYAVPASNPFVGNAAVLDEIWAIGLRNPWRFSFDRLTGDIWIGDVGQGAREEITYQPASSTGGENYGWRCYEGNQPYNTSGCGPVASYTFPVFDVGRSYASGGRSITGGFVYRGTQYPGLVGQYICCDYVTNNCWTIEPDGSGGWTSTLFTSVGISNCTSFGEAENGELYAATISGKIYEVIDANALPLELIHFSGSAGRGQNFLEWKSASEEHTDRFELQRSGDARRFTAIGNVTAAGNSLEERHYDYTDPKPLKGANYYRLKIIDLDGSYRFSGIIQVRQESDLQHIFLQPNPANDQVSIRFAKTPASVVSVEIFDMSGRRVLSRTGLQPLKEQSVRIADLAKGLYLMEVSGEGFAFREKLLVSR